IIFIAAVLVGLTGLFKLPIINFFEAHMGNFRREAFVLSLILFAPGSFFMAAVSPYALRLRIADVKNSGKTTGNLYAVSTVGSIVGTFLTGLILIPVMGNTKILFSLAILLLLASLLAFTERGLKPKVGAAILMILALFFSSKVDFHFMPISFIHSAYM